MKIPFLLLLITSTALAAPAQEGIDLDEAMVEARAQNPNFKKVEAQMNEASWKPLEALSVNLPQIQLSASHYFDVKFQTLDFNIGGVASTFPFISPYTLASADISWKVFDGLKGINSYRAARLASQAAQEEYSRAELQVDEDVHLKFFNALGTQVLKSVAEQDVVTLKDHLSKTQELLRRGSATKFDLLRVQVQLEEALSEKLAADDDAVVARKSLAVAMGQTEEDTRPLIGELPVPDEHLVIAEFKAEFSARQDIQALQNRADAADLAHVATIGTWIPSVTLAAEKQLYNNVTTDINGNYRDSYFVGVNLSWNIFDGGASLARFKETTYQAEQAHQALMAANLMAPEELETWKRKFYYNVELYRAKKRAVETAQESVRLANLGYGAGTRTSTDVLDAELDLFRAKAGVVRAQLDGIEAAGRLELALGKKIFKLQK